MEWVNRSNLGLYVRNPDPEEYICLMGKSTWRRHLIEEYVEGDAVPDPLRELGMVDVMGAHVSDGSVAKSLLFKSGDGGVVVIPEPPNVCDLISLIQNAISDQDGGNSADKIILTAESDGKAAKHRKWKARVGASEYWIPERQFLRLLCLIVARALSQGSIDPNDPKLGDEDVVALCWAKDAKTKSPAKFAQSLNNTLKKDMKLEHPVHPSAPPSGAKCGYTIRRCHLFDVSQVIDIPPDKWQTQLPEVVARLRQIGSAE